MVYAVLSQSFAGQEGNVTEQWYGTEYAIQDLDKVGAMAHRLAFATFIETLIVVTVRFLLFSVSRHDTKTSGSNVSNNNGPCYVVSDGLKVCICIWPSS